MNTHDLLAWLKPKREGDPLSLRGRRRRRVLISTAVIGLVTFNVYHIKQQLAPGHQQLTLQTERTWRDHGKLIRDVIAVTQVIFLTSGTTYPKPSDWDDGSNSIECFGGGQGGQNITACCFPAGNGGIGGGYAKSSNLTLSASTAIAIGAAGAANLGNGGNTTWATTTVVARGGGTATAQVGTTTRLGGNGGTHSNGGGGGGGAAGPNAAGSNGVNGDGLGNGGAGGQGDGAFGGTGGAGSSGGTGGTGNPGAEYTAVPAGGTAGSGGGGGASGAGGGGNGGQGGLYGGAGGGAGTIGGSVGGVGRQGLIVVQYNPLILAFGAPDSPYTSRRRYSVITYGPIFGGSST